MEHAQDESSMFKLKVQEASWIVISTTQDTRLTVISKEHPKVQSRILNISQPSASTSINIICGAVLKIVGITLLYETVGGTGPGSIVPSHDLLFP